MAENKELHLLQREGGSFSVYYIQGAAHVIVYDSLDAAQPDEAPPALSVPAPPSPNVGAEDDRHSFEYIPYALRLKGDNEHPTIDTVVKVYHKDGSKAETFIDVKAFARVEKERDDLQCQLDALVEVCEAIAGFAPENKPYPSRDGDYTRRMQLWEIGQQARAALTAGE